MFRLNFKKILTPVLLAASVILAGCSDDKTPVAEEGQDIKASVRVGMSGTYYPFTFMKEGELQGFEVDVWREIARRLALEVEFVTAPFSGLFGMLEAGQVDTIANQITLTKERAERYAFSQSYVYDGVQIAVHSDNKNINGFSDLKGRRVAVNLGSNFEQIIKARDPNNEIDVVTYDTGIEQDVVVGRSDAFVMDRISVLSLVEQSGLPLRLAGEPVETLENAMPFLSSEDGQALRNQVNEALDGMRTDGSLAEISEKWFGADITASPAG